MLTPTCSRANSSIYSRRGLSFSTTRRLGSPCSRIDFRIEILKIKNPLRKSMVTKTLSTNSSVLESRLEDYSAGYFNLYSPQCESRVKTDKDYIPTASLGYNPFERAYLVSPSSILVSRLRTSPAPCQDSQPEKDFYKAKTKQNISIPETVDVGSSKRKVNQMVRYEQRQEKSRVQIVKNIAERTRQNSSMSVLTIDGKQYFSVALSPQR